MSRRGNLCAVPDEMPEWIREDFPGDYRGDDIERDAIQSEPATSSKPMQVVSREEAISRYQPLLTAQGLPKKCQANTLSVIQQHSAWRGVLGYDLFRECVIKLAAPPVRPQDGAARAGEWTEADTTRAVAWFANNVGFEPSPQQVDAAVTVAAEAHSFHPVRDYLKALTWDGVPRVAQMLVTYFGATTDEYSHTVGQAWLVSAVARVMQPGCQADHMLVLEGAQGSGKSTGIEALCPSRDWYSDTGLRIGDKDSYQSLRGKMIYEFGELDALRGREITAIKSYISARSDSYRPSYGRRTRDFPRQCVFVGTTNEAEYLVDPTGNRRFWPVKCGSINVQAIRRDRDQLWAEALALYEDGAQWHVASSELAALVRDEQAAREVGDDWDELVSKWLRDPVRRPNDGISTAEVLKDALGMRAGEINRAVDFRDLWTPRGGIFQKHSPLWS